MINRINLLYRKLYRNFHFIYAGFGVAWTVETTRRVDSTSLSMFNLNSLPVFTRTRYFIMAQIVPLLGGVRGGSLGREISVHPVRKFGRGFKPLPHCIFSKLRPFGRRLLSNGVNISLITDLPTPKSPPKRGISNSKVFILLSCLNFLLLVQSSTIEPKHLAFV